MSQYKEIEKEVADNIEKILNYEEYGTPRKKLKYKGTFLTTVSINNGKGTTFLMDKHLLSIKDKEKIREWVHSDHKIRFRDDFYKLSLDKYILIFKEYTYDDEIILMGQFYEKTPVVRMMMLESQQQYLQEQLI